MLLGLHVDLRICLNLNWKGCSHGSRVNRLRRHDEWHLGRVNLVNRISCLVYYLLLLHRVSCLWCYLLNHPWRLNHLRWLRNSLLDNWCLSGWIRCGIGFLYVKRLICSVFLWSTSACLSTLRLFRNVLKAHLFRRLSGQRYSPMQGRRSSDGAHGNLFLGFFPTGFGL